MNTKDDKDPSQTEGDKGRSQTDGNQDTEFSPTRRGLIMAAGAAAMAAPLMGVGSAWAVPGNGNGNGQGQGQGQGINPGNGFPRPTSLNQIWVLDYAGNLWPGMRNGPALFAMFHPATGIHVQPNGTLKVADARNSVIRNISNLGDVTMFSGSSQQYPFKDGAATEATYNSPNDIDRLSNGDFVVADRENNAIRLVLADGSVRTIAGQGNCKSRYNGDQANALNALLNRPLTLHVTHRSTAWHGIDTIYFADRDNSLIRKLVPNGDGTWAVETVAGVPPTVGADPCGPLTYYPGSTNGPVDQAKFRGPCGLVLSDNERYLYVAERDNNVIRVIDLMMGIVGTYAGVVIVGQGKGAYQDGPAATAKFNGPSQVDIDGGRNLFLADRFNHIIRRITPSANPMLASQVQTYAGTPMESGRMSGPANIAQFYEPWGLSIDRRRGLIFVGDTGNSRVAVIGRFRDIWAAFVQRLNTARIAEYQALSAEYNDYFNGSPERNRQRPPYTDEGIGIRPEGDGM